MRTLGARSTRGTVSTNLRSPRTASVCRVPSLPRTSSARGTVSRPPERQRIPRPWRVPTLHDIPIDIPRGTGGRYGTRSTRMRWRRTRSGGVGGRAGAVSRRRRARCTTAQHRSERAPSAECASEYPEYPEYPESASGYSGCSHGVSRAWTRVGGTRDGTVSGSPSVLARPRPSTPRGTRSTHTGSSEDSHGGALDAHRAHAKPPTRALCEYVHSLHCEYSRTALRVLSGVLRVLTARHSEHSQRLQCAASRAFSAASAASAVTSRAFAAVRSALCAARAAVAAAHLSSAAVSNP